MISLKNKVIENKSFVQEILRRLNSNDHEICLYDNSTGEKIMIGNNLIETIKVYYEDRLIEKEVGGRDE